MITFVADQSVLAISDSLAAEHGIKPGSHLDREATDKPDVLTVKVLLDYAALASSFGFEQMLALSFCDMYACLE